MPALFSVISPVFSTQHDIAQVLKHALGEWMTAIFLDNTLVPYRSGMRLRAYIEAHYKNSSLKCIVLLTIRIWFTTSNILFNEGLKRDDFLAILKILVSKATN